ncbi:ATP-binding protein [Mesobacillus subterraneus]|uniref:YhaN AAA domain-containing protein n=1 Tax=Mesobacillus subterraneus TaxID=285983 RepID=A0A3R9FLN0_9BACI|nr:AAA family ATPase [Mesobacillus subterraneus]RSD29272.1 hypothetical protein EJA10_01055 [Mesobacillus subterraneus]
MKLIELHIYGYGKLEDRVIESLDQLQVFYGENEAGKSTIMSFIHSILFGFPAKQSAELRYQPKHHSKYGGKIKASFENKGIAVIERVKGRAAGDVTVSLEDGTIGGEELLKELLKGIDKSIFQAIFSFNVHGLQNIQNIKGEDLGRYLFSAGTLGTDKLFTIEGTLLKEMEQRFKPSGKKPVLNEKLKELKEVQSSLKIAEQQNERYSELVREKGNLLAKIAQLESELKELEQKESKLREYKRNEPFVIETAALERKLSEMGQVNFPLDGLNRFEKLDHHMNQIKAKKMRLQDKQLEIREVADNTRPDPELLEREAEIEARLESIPLYNQLKQEQRVLEIKLEEMTEEISQINDHLHVDFNESTIQEVNTSIFIKEQAEAIQHSEQRMAEKKLELEADFEEEKTTLADLEDRAVAAKKDLLSANEREKLKMELEVLENKEQIVSELNYVRDQIQFHKTSRENEKTRRESQKKKGLSQLILFGGIFLLVMVWGMANNQWVLAGIGIVGLVFLAATHLMQNKEHPQGEKDEVLTNLLVRERTLAEALNSQPSGNLFSIKSLLAKDEEAGQRHREILVKLEQQQVRFEKVLLQFEKWEAENAELKKMKADLMADLGLGEKTGPIKILDAFLLIEKQKQNFRERNRTKDRLKASTSTILQIEENLRILAERFLKNANLEPVETAALLKTLLRDAIDKKAKHRELAIKLEEIDEEYESLLKEEQLISEDISGLLTQAGAQDEEEFRHKAGNDEQFKGLNSRLEDLLYQLEAGGITDSDREAIITGAPLEELLSETKEAIKQCKKEHSNLIDRIADVKHKMKVLEEGGLYSELLHKYKQLQHEFAEDAREWASYAVARDLLSRTIDRYKDERLPRMLAKAESFLALLTDGNYGRIIPQAEGSGFLIERKDHVLFEANELSQATAEQVYVSIRLALAAVHFERYPFPIIIDDSFVNFDHNRTARIIGLLREMSAHHQIFFFTCHRHLLQHFREGEVMNLEQSSTNVV